MIPKRLRMDLVDRDVDVLVIGVVVTDCDVLVSAEPQSLHEPFHNLLKLFSFEAPIVGVKRDDEVIRALGPGAGVLDLDRVDELAGELQVVFPADPRQIGGVEPRGARLGLSAPDVARQVPETPVRYRFALMPDDQRCPASRFTARRTLMTESMSSRFSRWWLDRSETPSRMASLSSPPMRLRLAWTRETSVSAWASMVLLS